MIQINSIYSINFIKKFSWCFIAIGIVGDSIDRKHRLEEIKILK